jgi:hypothetical protein
MMCDFQYTLALPTRIYSSLSDNPGSEVITRSSSKGNPSVAVVRMDELGDDDSGLEARELGKLDIAVLW